MEQNPVVKRLYVGGLVHTVSKTELQERFGKFGNVTEIEIVTRKDEQGQPTKTFAYINITISDKELKKCISVLNKSKWKGGTLQIELAKESFLHRLARERQEASVKKETPHSNGMTNVIESLEKSGVVDFHVKAVPGTEVPDHKDWVVGKFGRVLPILHLKSQHKNKIIKYDPSKYCHNLKKLNPDFSETVPISQLTWYLEEGDNRTSKKRQGQFPVAKKTPKKRTKVKGSDNLNRTEPNSLFSSKTTNIAPIKLPENHTPNMEKQDTKRSVHQKLRIGLTSSSNISKLSESDIDSEEEIKALMAREKEIHTVNSDIESEDDNMEVVRDDFELKYATHWSLQKACDAKKVHKRCDGQRGTSENESDYDSAGTDEILAKTPNKKRKKNEVLKGSMPIKGGREDRSESGILTHATSSGSLGLTKSKSKEKKRAVLEKTFPMAAPEHSHITNQCNSKDGGSSDSLHDTSESEEDEDYEIMMQNCYQLDQTLKDLERLAGENTETTDEEADGNQIDTQCNTKESPISNTSNITKTSRVNATAKKMICPEEIVSAILEEESSDEENSKKKRSRLKVQPFRGMGSLNINEMTTEVTKGELDIHKSEDNQDASYLVNLETLKNVSNSQCSDPAGDHFTCKSHSLREINSDSHENSDCSTHSAEDSEEGCSGVNVVSETNLPINQKSLSKRTKLKMSPKGSDFVQTKNSPLKNKEQFLDSAKPLGTLDQKEKHLQDNMKRLAALQERQKEREIQKKLIQGALTNLETQSTSKQKHIVFDSDGASEDEVEERTTERFSGKRLKKELSTKTSGKLFESSEDESDTSGEEDDRFKIKPQFEGKAGEKLMHLQSRFGTDERFRMDARFLESDSEQEDDSEKMEVNEKEENLALEKKKNLEILKNLLHLNIEPSKPSKQAANTMKFRDINAIRYDPTRQDHAMFEKKPEVTEKESKATRKKKREEAEKLPEVSKEIFYNVAVDLREVLGSTKHHEKTEIIPWDKHDAVEPATADDTETLTFTAGSDNQEETNGFTFSFFGAENETTPIKEDPYVIETIKPARVAWQEDPRFQDRSSEEEDELELAESEDVKEVSPALPHSNVRFFFFMQGDSRLKEGPKLFCKSSNLDEDRGDWESRRQMLLEDCRKKHKDARRKVKAKI
ncbi:nucleolar protein 8 [Tiliqua scincoides]|uniref:nucleolar protein 8 n=1 Tax=Tiliqua scincoides TaxID=71010 RepID=UPI003462CD3C